MEENSSVLVNEPWVDAVKVAEFTGHKPDHVRKLASSGKIPAVAMTHGKKKHWRFKLSLIDNWMKDLALSNCSVESN